MVTIERRDIWRAEETEGPWNELVLAYALAFGKLAGPVDPVLPESWTIAYQAAVHDMSPRPAPSDLRATCQHDTWFFLPWHRMYLFNFEAVLKAIITGLDDDRISEETRSTWALPYWNYQLPRHRILPTAFRDAQLPDGEPNPLAAAHRFPKVQNGTRPLSEDQVEYAEWWRQTVFNLPGTPSFGGRDTSGPRHLPLQGFPDSGALEQTPHGTVHGYVGWDMQSFDTAGLDPIFWLHHCNLDRLWEVWCHGGGVVRPNPPTGAWTTHQFEFLDATGAIWSRTSKQVEKTEDLGYTYEDIGAPTAPPSPTRSRTVEVAGPDQDEWRRELAPRTLGSTAAPVVVRSEAASVGFDLERDDEVRTRSGRPAPARLILRVDNIGISDDDAARVQAREAVIGTYALYLEGNRDGVEAFVGNLPLFGLRESLTDAGHQLAYSFDATSAVNLLRNQDAWTWDHIDVRIEPSNHEAYEGAGEVVAVTFGNVTLSYQ